MNILIPALVAGFIVAALGVGMAYDIYESNRKWPRS